MSSNHHNRRQQRIAQLQQQWDLLNDKISRLEQSLILETRVEEKLRLLSVITLFDGTIFK
jgi:hypothetical protein